LTGSATLPYLIPVIRPESGRRYYAATAIGVRIAGGVDERTPSSASAGHCVKGDDVDGGGDRSDRGSTIVSGAAEAMANMLRRFTCRQIPRISKTRKATRSKFVAMKHELWKAGYER